MAYKERNYPLHWSFALGTAISTLEALVRTFDVDKESKGHSYSGIDPRYFLEIIDGFLSENQNLMPSDITRLTEMRVALTHAFIPAYMHGLETATKRWQSVNASEQDEIAAYDYDEFRNDVNVFIPENYSAQQINWFREAYYVRWQEEWMAYHKRKFERGEL
jgi:hypothetical protein